MTGKARYIKEALRMMPEDQFFGRRDVIDDLLERMLRLPDFPVQSCFLSGLRRAGSSEIVKRVYLELFLNQQKVIPFYYRFERVFNDPSAFVRDYLTTLIRQYLAFRDNDPALLVPEVISFQSVEKMANQRAIPALERLLGDYHSASEELDREALVRMALHAPLMLAEASSGFACMILDHLHLIFEMDWASCASLGELYPAVMGYERAPHLFTGLATLLRRGFLGQESMTGLVRRMDLPALTRDKVLEVFSGLCERYEISHDPDLVEERYHLFNGIPFYVFSLVQRAWETGTSFTSPEALRDLYHYEVSQGQIAFYYESLLNRCFGDPLEKRDAIRILALPAFSAGKAVSIEEVAARVSLELSRVQALTESLILVGLLDGKYGMVAGIRDPVLNDFLTMTQRFWLGKPDLHSGRNGGEKKVAGEKRVPVKPVEKPPEAAVVPEMSADDEPESGEFGESISFGLVLPMVSETELVAARALEQVAERVDFPDEEIGKVRMALIEACINSFEHSGSRDRKIYITFTLDGEKMTIVVEDKGVSFDPDKVPVPGEGKDAPSSQRRGWGIQLIKSLMDEVKFEDVPVGTRLKMIKYYPKAAAKKAKAV